MKDGVRIVVPDDLAVLTSYVLREQADWFGRELDFLRTVVDKGDHVVDVGAGFGVYTLPLAARVGPTGKVQALEPGELASRLLRESLDENHFTWVSLERAVAADEDSRRDVAIGPTPEHAQLQAPGSFAAVDVPIEKVTARPLDAFAEALAPVSFVRIHNEGAEGVTLRGGAKLIAQGDPLVMIDTWFGGRITDAMLTELAERGLTPYRLVPGLRVLAPFDAKNDHWRAASSLFAASDTRAELLERRGLLVRRATKGVALDRSFARRFDVCPYRKLIRGRDVPASLAWFAMAKEHPDVGTRLFALAEALEKASVDVRERASTQRRLTLARIAAESGETELELAELDTLIHEIDIELEASEAPFLPPLERFDNVVPIGTIGTFMAASTVEAKIRHSAPSGYFQGPEQLTLLDAFAGFPFSNHEMARRHELAKLRFAR